MPMTVLGAVGGEQTNSLSSQKERFTQHWANSGTSLPQRHLHRARETHGPAGA